MGVGLDEVGVDALQLARFSSASWPIRSRPILPMNDVGHPTRAAHTATLAALPPGISITSPNVSPPRSSSLFVRISTSHAKSPMTQRSGALTGTMLVGIRTR